MWQRLNFACFPLSTSYSKSSRKKQCSFNLFNPGCLSGWLADIAFYPFHLWSAKMASNRLNLNDVNAPQLVQDVAEDEDDRQLSARIVHDVMGGAAKCFAEAGLDDDLVERFRCLWMSKMAAAGGKEATAGREIREMANRVAVDAQPQARPSGAAGGARPKSRPVKKRKAVSKKPLPQVDGPHDTSDEDEDLDKDDDDDVDDDDDDDDDDLDKDDENDEEDDGVEEEPLGSEDDISDEVRSTTKPRVAKLNQEL